MTDMGMRNDQLQVECNFWAPILGGGGLRYRGGFVLAPISHVQPLGTNYVRYQCRMWGVDRTFGKAHAVSGRPATLVTRE